MPESKSGKTQSPLAEMAEAMDALGNGFLKFSQALQRWDQEGLAWPLPGFTPGAAQPDIWQQLQRDIRRGDQAALLLRLEQMLEQGHGAREILNQGLLTAMEEIGRQFGNGVLSIPEVMFAAQVLNAAFSYLEPYLAGQDQEQEALIMIGTVQGDLHDIGKNLVLTMLRGMGYKTLDLGIDVPAERFVQEVVKHQPQVLGLSALLTTTIPRIQEVLEAISQAGLRNNLKIMVGGAPVSQEFADRIGADGYAANAGDAMVLVKRLLQSGQV